MSRRRRPDDPLQDDLFSLGVVGGPKRVDPARWPAQNRFPLNAARRSVRSVVWDDLVVSPSPTIVAGYASIGELIDLVAEWDGRRHAGELRVLLGAEPFPSSRATFRDPSVEFTADVREYWLERHGVSLDQSTRVVVALEASRAGRLRVRFIHGTRTLHAKIYVGDQAATAGSSNFTSAGLDRQYEVNSRFERDDDQPRYDELASVAEVLWDQGTPWDEEFRALLEAMLRLTGWREALARACALLLEGEWATRYIGDVGAADGLRLWPSQEAGIAQALWITENVGSVLIADATGSGKTRMGAHLIRAIRDRLWATGRARSDLAVLVCPPAVEPTWNREAMVCGMSMTTVSHGLLSRGGGVGETRSEDVLISRAQILAVDEAHHYLNPSSARTRSVRSSNADHVALFTATPINRGAADLLQLVGLLGPDNFEDATLAILSRLERRRSRDGWLLSGGEVDQLRREIQRFTVRRTKTQLNNLVDGDPDAYLHPQSGRVCRYPAHEPHTYTTGETPHDDSLARAIRTEVSSLVGVVQLERSIAVPAALTREVTPLRWLEQRLTSIHGLSAHHVLSTMRSSGAALVEHLSGTESARSRFGLDRFKAAATGDVIGRLLQLADEGPPTLLLDCTAPAWLTTEDRWRDVCAEELVRYRRIRDLAGELSDARERAKARLLVELASRHRLVLAFDQHLITLAVLQTLIDVDHAEIFMATGSDTSGRSRLQRVFARDSHATAIALCSDAMNEGLNLQGASAVVHLDLPTTLRVAEQRIGRVDRMDSPHERIEAWWPDDGPEFATRSNEVLIRRTEESAELLGSNLPMPAILRSDGSDKAIDVKSVIEEAEHDEEPYDGIGDALEPVRSLVSGDRPLIDAVLYDHYRDVASQQATRLSAVAAAAPWAFLAVSGGTHGAPKWMLLDALHRPPITDVGEIATALRARLEAEPFDVELNEPTIELLTQFVSSAARHERLLLPRRHLKAIEQMSDVTQRWAAIASANGDFATRNRWQALRELPSPPSTDEAHGDLFEIAERWLGLITPTLEDERANRRRPYILVTEITGRLARQPMDYDTVAAAMQGVRSVVPLAQRISSCILGSPHGQQPRQAQTARRSSA